MKIFLIGALRWGLVALLGLVVLTLPSDSRRFNPAQRVAAPYLHNLVSWELNNFFSKWLFKASGVLSDDSDARRERDTREYFSMNTEMAHIRARLRTAAAWNMHEQTASMQALLDDAEAQAAALTDGAEETIESYISAVLVEDGLAVFGEVILPPVDVRLVQPPKLLITSPRDRIYRQHDVLLRPDVNLSAREIIEYNLLRDENFSALVEDIGGLATYPASVSNGHPIRWTLQASAHEWLHHYFFFQPLGQHMFDDDDMFNLNETIASVVGKEIGDRAFKMMSEDFFVQQTLPPVNASDDDDNVEEEKFDFATEMRRTRLEVEAMLEDGRVEDAEAYMERRRRLFVENGYAIRKLNQAYFAFYGTYADLPAAISPIGDEVKRFRALVPHLGDFIKTVSRVSSYDEFLRVLDELENRS